MLIEGEKKLGLYEVTRALFCNDAKGCPPDVRQKKQPSPR
jgi:hypothetical protein